jgi:hypothetical protein
MTARSKIQAETRPLMDKLVAAHTGATPSLRPVTFGALLVSRPVPSASHSWIALTEPRTFAGYVVESARSGVVVPHSELVALALRTSRSRRATLAGTSIGGCLSNYDPGARAIALKTNGIAQKPGIQSRNCLSQFLVVAVAKWICHVRAAPRSHLKGIQNSDDVPRNGHASYPPDHPTVHPQFTQIPVPNNLASGRSLSGSFAHCFEDPIVGRRGAGTETARQGDDCLRMRHVVSRCIPAIERHRFFNPASPPRVLSLRPQAPFIPGEAALKNATLKARRPQVRQQSLQLRGRTIRSACGSMRSIRTAAWDAIPFVVGRILAVRSRRLSVLTSLNDSTGIFATVGHSDLRLTHARRTRSHNILSYRRSACGDFLDCDRRLTGKNALHIVRDS